MKRVKKNTTWQLPPRKSWFRRHWEDFSILYMGLGVAFTFLAGLFFVLCLFGAGATTSNLKQEPSVYLPDNKEVKVYTRKVNGYTHHVYVYENGATYSENWAERRAKTTIPKVDVRVER